MTDRDTRLVVHSASDGRQRAAKKSGASKKQAAGGEEAGEERSLWRDFRGFSVMFWALAWCCLVV